jgi:hypothetical protein
MSFDGGTGSIWRDIGFASRFVVRLFWVELAASAVAIAAAVLAAVIVITRLQEVAPSADCLRAQLLGDPLAGCRDVSEFLRRGESETGPVLAAFGLLPLLLGGLLGVVAGARDIDEGAAPLAWSLYASRLRWLAERLMPLMVMLVVICAVSMVAADRVATARLLIADVGHTFRDYGVTSWPILLRMLAIFSMGLLFGLIAGRQVPALLLAAGAAIVLPLALAATMPYGEPLRAIEAQMHQATDEARLGLDFWAAGQLLRAADGTLLTHEEALAKAPNPNDYRAALAWVDANHTVVDLVIPGAGRPSVEAREAAVLLTGSATLVVAAAVVARRRRPY